MQQQPCKLDCGNTATLKCSQCKQAYYCSPICQRVDWQREHRLICREIAASLATTADLRNYYLHDDEVQLAIGDDTDGGGGGGRVPYQSIIKDMLHMAFVQPLGSITTDAAGDLGGVAERIGLSYNAPYPATMEAVRTMIKSLQLAEKRLILAHKRRMISPLIVDGSVPAWLLDYIVHQDSIINVEVHGTRVLYDYVITGEDPYLMEMWFDGRPFITKERITKEEEFKILWEEKGGKNLVHESAKHLRGPYIFKGTVFWYWSVKESTRTAAKKK